MSRITPGSVAGIVIFATMILSSAGCTTERTASLRAMGRWTETDVHAFWSDITGAPRWIANDVKRSSNDFYNTAAYAVYQTKLDTSETGRMLAGAPGYVASEASKDISSLTYTLKSGGGWMRDDARETGNNIAGAPGYIAHEVSGRSRDFAAFSVEVYRKFRVDVRMFPVYFMQTVEMLFIK